MIIEERDQHLIKVCEEENLNDLMQFLDAHWSPGHILSRSRELLRWQHFNAERNLYHYLLAIHKKTKEIIGVLGYVPVAHFDPALAEQRAVWKALWKVREDVQIAGLGMNLRSALLEYEKPLSVGALGMNPKTRNLYRAFGYTIITLDQYYQINRKAQCLNIISGFEGSRAQQRGCPSSAKSLRLLSLEDLSSLEKTFRYEYPSSTVPQKSVAYLINRYTRHPMYRYSLFSIEEAGECRGIIVVRKLAARQSAVLKIIDYLGSEGAWVGLQDEFQRLLELSQCEAIDVLNFGFQQQTFYDAGFLKLNRDGPIKVPTYFEPFVQENVGVLCAYKAQPGQQYLIFRGDGDQDRPSILEEPHF